MIAVDEDALICDFAETYGVLDMRALPVPLMATLAVGLRENSRIKTKLSGLRHPFDMILLAIAADKLNFLAWTKTQDAQSGINKPESLAHMLLYGEHESAEKQSVTYSSAEEFEKAKAKIKEEINNGK